MADTEQNPKAAPVPYWDRPEWPAQLEENISAKTEAWLKDWGPLFRGIAERCNISLTDAIMFYTSHQVTWWTHDNAEYLKRLDPLLRHMQKEIDDLKHGDDWKDEQ